MALRLATPVRTLSSPAASSPWANVEKSTTSRVCMAWQTDGIHFNAALSSSSSSFVAKSVESVSSFFEKKRGLRFRSNASAELAGGGGDEGGGGVGGGHGGGDGEGGEGETGGSGNREEALMVLSGLERSLESLPADLAAAIKDGRITAAIVKKYCSLERSPFMSWLLQFGGFKERLLADDLFMTKVGIECGVGIFTKVSSSF